jgi:urease accessory protein
MSRTPTRTRTHIITTEPAHAARAAADESAQLLRLLHLASPALPIGAFHFSQGLEYAVEAGWVHDAGTAHEWIDGIAHASFGRLDLPVLCRLRAAWAANDTGAVLRWNAFLLATRETAELRAEDRHLGAALLRVLVELDLSTELFPVGAASRTDNNRVGVAHATAFAFACARWGIAPLAAGQAYAWAWAENLVLAAVKLIPLGQSAGQRMLHALNPRLGALAGRSVEFADSDIGISTVLQSVASGRHETQYTRLFRS